MTAYTTPGPVSNGEADPDKFNTETVNNIKYLKEHVDAIEVGVVVSGGNSTIQATTDVLVNASDDIFLTSGDAIKLDATGQLQLESDGAMFLTTVGATSDIILTSADDIFITPTDRTVIAGADLSINATKQYRNGSQVPLQAWFSFSATTDGSGDITFNHLFGASPSGVIGNVASTSQDCTPTGFTSSVFKLRITNKTGTPQAGASVAGWVYAWYMN